MTSECGARVGVASITVEIGMAGVAHRGRARVAEQKVTKFKVADGEGKEKWAEQQTVLPSPGTATGEAY